MFEKFDERPDPRLDGFFGGTQARCPEGVAPHGHVRTAMSLHWLPPIDNLCDQRRGEYAAVSRRKLRQVWRRLFHVRCQRAIAMCRGAVTRSAVRLEELAAGVLLLPWRRGRLLPSSSSRT